ncbi:hypothetical protein POM88_038990 [Heracleum sosnowskyi]|uniref:Pectinesterase inhibitor domain-containing protein n=1 Tax=Heracleum sosnowskyi TaxID=360622 RepID=A0AAD8HAD8_9APIA|nr:hypothetical protein POM88_038990 [Heracleum sosnowskyi]
MDPSTETTLLENQSSSAFPKKNTPSSVFTLVDDPTPTKSIQAVCSFAPYRQLCISSLSTSNSTNTSSDDLDTYFFTESILFRSFQLSINQLINLANISNPDDIPELRECRTLLNKEVSGLSDSVTSYKKLYSFTGHEVSE